MTTKLTPAHAEAPAIETAAATATVAPPPASDPEMAPAPAPDRADFERLADEWERDTWFVGNIGPYLKHPAYLQIIGMGPAAVPWLLARLTAGGSGHWLVALWELSGANPVPPESRGRIREMVAAWQEWGRQQGYTW